MKKLDSSFFFSTSFLSTLMTIATMPLALADEWEQMGPGAGGQIYAMEFMTVNGENRGFVGSDVAPFWIGHDDTVDNVWKWEPADVDQQTLGYGQDFELHPSEADTVFVALDKGVFTYEITNTGAGHTANFSLYDTATPSMPSSVTRASSVSAGISTVPATDELNVFVAHGDIWQGSARSGSAGGIFRRTDSGNWQFMEIPGMNDETTGTDACESGGGETPGATNQCPAIHKVSVNGATGEVAVATENGIYYTDKGYCKDNENCDSDGTDDVVKVDWERVDKGNLHSASATPPKEAKSFIMAAKQSNPFGSPGSAGIAIFPATTSSDGGLYAVEATTEGGNSVWKWTHITTSAKLTGGNDFAWQALAIGGTNDKSVYISNNESNSLEHQIWEIKCDGCDVTDLDNVAYTALFNNSAPLQKVNLGWAKNNYPGANPNSLNFDNTNNCDNGSECLFVGKNGVFYRWRQDFAQGAGKWEFQYTKKLTTSGQEKYRQYGMVNTAVRAINVLNNGTENRVYWGEADRGIWSQPAPGSKNGYAIHEEMNLNEVADSHDIESGGFIITDGSDNFAGGSRGNGSTQEESGVFIWDDTNDEWDLIGGGWWDDNSTTQKDKNSFDTGDNLTEDPNCDPNPAVEDDEKRAVNAPFGAGVDAAGDLYVVTKGNMGGVWKKTQPDPAQSETWENMDNWTLLFENDDDNDCVADWFHASIDFYEDTSTYTNMNVEWMLVALRRHPIDGDNGGYFLNYRTCDTSGSNDCNSPGHWGLWGNGYVVSEPGLTAFKAQFDSSGNIHIAVNEKEDATGFYGGDDDSGVWKVDFNAGSDSTPSYDHYDESNASLLTSLNDGQVVLGFELDGTDLYASMYSSEDPDDAKVSKYSGSGTTWNLLYHQPPFTKSLGPMFFDEGGSRNDLYLGTQGMGVWVNKGVSTSSH